VAYQYQWTDPSSALYGTWRIYVISPRFQRPILEVPRGWSGTLVAWVENSGPSSPQPASSSPWWARLPGSARCPGSAGFPTTSGSPAGAARLHPITSMLLVSLALTLLLSVLRRR